MACWEILLSLMLPQNDSAMSFRARREIHSLPCLDSCFRRNDIIWIYSRECARWMLVSQVSEQPKQSPGHLIRCDCPALLTALTPIVTEFMVEYSRYA